MELLPAVWSIDHYGGRGYMCCVGTHTDSYHTNTCNVHCGKLYAVFTGILYIFLEWLSWMDVKLSVSDQLIEYYKSLSGS